MHAFRGLHLTRHLRPTRNGTSSRPPPTRPPVFQKSRPRSNETPPPFPSDPAAVVWLGPAPHQSVRPYCHPLTLPPLATYRQTEGNACSRSSVLWRGTLHLWCVALQFHPARSTIAVRREEEIAPRRSQGGSGERDRTALRSPLVLAQDP
jgi:hypothetical protein